VFAAQVDWKRKKLKKVNESNILVLRVTKQDAFAKA